MATIRQDALQKGRRARQNGKSLLLKYMLFKSLGPDKHCFSKFNSFRLWEKYKAALEAFVIKRKQTTTAPLENFQVLDCGAGWGILSIVIARILKDSNIAKSINVTKVEGMKPISAAIRRFFAVHSTEFDVDSSDEEEERQDGGGACRLTFSCANFLSSLAGEKEKQKQKQAGKADVVLLDTMSPIFFTPTPVAGGLGHGIIDCLKSLSEHDLITKETTFFPSQASIYCQLVNIPPQSSVPPMSFCVDEAEGFDISLFNMFRETAGASQRLDYTPLRCVEHETLSAPVRISHMDLKQIALDDSANGGFEEAFSGVDIVRTGTFNAVVYWYGLSLGGDEETCSYSPTNEMQPLCRQGVYLVNRASARSLVRGEKVSFRVSCDPEKRYPFHFAFSSEKGDGEPPEGEGTDLLLSRAKSNAEAAGISKGIPGVSRWHFSMLWDTERNRAYDSALKKTLALRKGAKVLDIGTGTGLLAMMAARAGARTVTACELNAAMAACSRLIVERNGFSPEQITVLSLNSNQLRLETLKDSERFDVCVSEILDCGLLGENVLPSVRDARTRLLKEDAVVIPHAAKVYGILISLDVTQGAPLSVLPQSRSEASHRMDTRVFAPFTRTTTAYEQIRLADVKHTKLSDPFVLFQNIDLASGSAQPSEIFPYVDGIKESGVAHGVAIYFDLYLDNDKEIVLSTGPQNRTTCWAQAVHFFKKPVIVKEGDSMVLKAKHDCQSISVDHVPENEIL
jgi:2-polyprenyl-3-methyl-5-hydroxy-6-metoxy-1,4-benzoquinol methylase